jgi:hypothetical protein
MPSISARTLELVDAVFDLRHRSAAISAIEAGVEAAALPGERSIAYDERVAFSMLKLSGNDLAALERVARLAGEDARDLFVAAGFEDPASHLAWHEVRTAAPVQLELTRAHALVLFELVSRFDQGRKVDLEGEAEVRAMWDLAAVLERTLAEPFRRDYGVLLRAARAELSDAG